VDVVDLSPEMINIGKEIENTLDRSDRVRFYEADVSKPLDHLSLESYDIVMANWVFDHACSIEALEGMWHNVEAHLKRGGKFLGIRVSNPHSPAWNTTKYGVSFENYHSIPGGLAYTCTIHSEPPLVFEATSMEVSYSGSFKLHEKFGLIDMEIMPYELGESVQNDRSFWELFLKDPPFAVVKAIKKP
jgi:toxoflavin synthase